MLVKWFKNYLYNKKKERETVLRNVVWSIREFYVDKHTIKNTEETYNDIETIYASAREDLQSLGIYALSVKNGILTMRVARPGLLIGRKGENINKLRDFLKEKNGIKDIDIEEETILPYLYPYEYNDDDLL